MNNNKIKEYLELLKKSEELGEEINRIENEIISDMENENIIEVTDPDSIEKIRLIKYYRYNKWNIEKLREVLGDDFDKFVKEKDRFSVDSEKLQKNKDDIWEEIEKLADKKDPHYLIETGDLLILCFELLLEAGVDIDEVVLKCFERYEKKLGELIGEIKDDG